MDVDDALCRFVEIDQGPSGGGHLPEADTETDDEVRLGDRVANRLWHRQSGFAAVDVAEVVDDVVESPGGEYRKVVVFGEGGEVGPGIEGPSATARDDDGTFGIGDGGDDRIEFVAGRCRPFDRHRSDVGVGRVVAQHVLRQRDRDRPGSAAGGDLERHRDRFGQLVDIIDLGRPLGDGSEKGAVVDLLKGLSPHLVGGDLADQHHHRL